MSRIGKQPLQIPSNVEVKINDGIISVKGPKGELLLKFPDVLDISMEGDRIIVKPKGNTKQTRSLWGTFRSHIKNMLLGVTEGFVKKLEVRGVGYKFQLDGKDLVMSLGFSHPIRIKAEEGIDFLVEKNFLFVSGIDKQKVGEISAKIRSFKKPEPYKGKGIRYEGEIVKIKAGKKVASS